MADYDREYGPDTEMPASGKAMIVAVLANRDCRCEALKQHKVSGECGRCMALDYCKKHWPWWYFTTIGNMGADRGV